MTITGDRTGTKRIIAGPYARRHPRAVAGIRIVVTLWLLALAGIFVSYGEYWGAILVAPAALNLWLAYQLRGVVQSKH
jgi:hypothetical protein